MAQYKLADCYLTSFCKEGCLNYTSDWRSQSDSARRNHGRLLEGAAGPVAGIGPGIGPSAERVWPSATLLAVGGFGAIDFNQISTL